jgi:hypothetical protein
LNLGGRIPTDLKSVPATALTTLADDGLMVAVPGKGFYVKRLRRMRYRPGLLDGFLASTHLNLTPSIPSLLRRLLAPAQR